jgi:hypothetical protein
MQTNSISKNERTREIYYVVEGDYNTERDFVQFGWSIWEAIIKKIGWKSGLRTWE